MISIISTINAQNIDFIDVRKGKDLKEIRIHVLNDNYVTYEKNGSLHDVINTNINFIIKEGRKYLFDKEGVMNKSTIVQNENSTTIKDYVISTTGFKKNVVHTHTTPLDTVEIADTITEKPAINLLNTETKIEEKSNVDNMNDDIFKLKEMYDNEIIDKDEFIQMKNKIFDKEEKLDTKNEGGNSINTTEENELPIEPPSLVENKIIYIRPLALLDGFSGSKLGAGIQIKIAEKMYFKQFLGYVSRGKELFINPGTTFDNGFETRSDLKFIQSEKIMEVRHKQSYFSLDIGYKRMWGLNIKYNDEGYYSINGNTAYHNTFNFKFGQQHFYKSGFFIDWYLGLGIKNIIHPDMKYEYWYNEDLGDYGETNVFNNGGVYSSYTYEGRKTIPNFTAGIDIGIKF